MLKKQTKSPDDEDLKKKKPEKAEENSTEDKAAKTEKDADGGTTEPLDEEDTKDTSEEEVTEDSEQSETDPLEEILSNPEIKALYDKKVEEEVNAALSQRETQAENDKLLNMSPEERADHEMTERIKELERREKEISTREKKAEIVEELTGLQLPPVLAECFNYESDETLQRSKEEVIGAFKDALKQSVNERLRGSNLPKTTSSGPGEAGRKVRGSNFADIINDERKRGQK